MLPDRMSQLFISTASEPLVTLNVLGCHTFPLTVITVYESAKKKPSESSGLWIWSLLPLLGNSNLTSCDNEDQSFQSIQYPSICLLVQWHEEPQISRDNFSFNFNGTISVLSGGPPNPPIQDSRDGEPKCSKWVIMWNSPKWDGATTTSSLGSKTMHSGYGGNTILTKFFRGPKLWGPFPQWSLDHHSKFCWASEWCLHSKIS